MRSAWFMRNLLSSVDEFSRYNSEIERASLTIKPAAGWSPSSPHPGGVWWSAATAAFLRLGAEAGVRRTLSAVLVRHRLGGRARRWPHRGQSLSGLSRTCWTRPQHSPWEPQATQRPPPDEHESTHKF